MEFTEIRVQKEKYEILIRFSKSLLKLFEYNIYIK